MAAGAAAVVRADKLHVTLHFLGQVPADRVDAVREGIALPMTPFELTLREPRVWPGGIAVLESDAPPALLELHVRLGLALDALGLPVEQRPYRPHVTLAKGAWGRAARRRPSAVGKWTATPSSCPPVANTPRCNATEACRFRPSTIVVETEGTSSATTRGHHG